MKKLRKALAALGIGRNKESGMSPKQIRRLRVEKDFINLVQSSNGLIKFSEKLYTTYKATEYIVKNNIPGDFVECGVYKGRHIAMMAMTLLHYKISDRELYLYDTFAGMTKPGPGDVRTRHVEDPYDPVEAWESQNRGDHNLTCYASLEKVQNTIYATSYPKERFQFVKGDVKETVPNTYHNQIAMLRLDTDWYDLTRHELHHMYDLITPKGVLIIDDYGSHEGARKAVDEFFEERGIFPLLFRTTKTERAMVVTG